MCFTVFLAVSFAALTGCKKEGSSSGTIAALTGGTNADTENSQRQQDAFDREFEMLNSLEETPCIPDTSGAEKLVQAADRLNKWIQDRQPDVLWKSDEQFTALEKSAAQTADTARKALVLLSLLQGQEIKDKQEQVIKPTETLEEERKQLTEVLSQLETQLKSLAAQTGISAFAVFSETAASIQKRFQGLNAVKNLNAAGIKAFAKQLENETVQFRNVAETLEHYASELRTDGLFVQPSDVDYLKQCTWLRDISEWACGDKQEPLERVKNLFDWTVCNIDIRDPNNPLGIEAGQNTPHLPLQYPWQTLILGFGSVWDRAWVFTELLKQQRIDSCLLSADIPAVQNNEQPDNGQNTAQKVRFIWAVGVFVDNQIYLFSPIHGLPFPAKNSASKDSVVFAADGSLDFQNIATLADVLKDDSLLRQMDLSEKKKFPLTTEHLKNTTALLPIQPESVSSRMCLIQAHLSGRQNMSLYTNLKELRRKIPEFKEISAVELWKYPLSAKFEQILLFRQTAELMTPFRIPNPKRNDYPLWAGRVLYFKGNISGQEGAMIHYQQARVPDREIMEYRSNAEFRNNPLQEGLFRLVTMYASFWLGTAAFESQSTESARDFLERLDKEPQRNAWYVLTKYLLGRIAEREKRYDDAFKYYGSTAGSPAEEGNLLRLKFLKQTLEKKK
ncbi:hypothetical protein FACS18942_07310 [Planctomycetales bacterium]|nr:hypothetical protein FACS18942_07310 [Planctomycetales bacterium]GHT38100.1 hypothetical protein FACS189427_11940 [Planctomycetales bacterium]